MSYYPNNQSNQPATSQRKSKDPAIKAAYITGILGIVAVIIGAYFSTHGFGTLNSSQSPSSPAGTSSLVQLHGSYNSGTWMQSNEQIPFSVIGISEDTKGQWSATGGKLGTCTITISNGVVRPDNSVSFSINQLADSSTGCPNASADLTGTVTSDGSSLNGTWSGQFQGQPFSGTWELS